MGSPDFPQKIFEKIFNEDILRLRSMEDMWKSRRAPEPLDFDKISQQASGLDALVAQKDQVVWSLQENFFMFTDRYEFPEND
jgi:ubiquitin-like 1-activating enzyme E1 B